jgi:hypothetical protein
MRSTGLAQRHDLFRKVIRPLYSCWGTRCTFAMWLLAGQRGADGGVRWDFVRCHVDVIDVIDGRSAKRDKGAIALSAGTMEKCICRASGIQHVIVEAHSGRCLGGLRDSGHLNTLFSAGMSRTWTKDSLWNSVTKRCSHERYRCAFILDIDEDHDGSA